MASTHDSFQESDAHERVGGAGDAFGDGEGGTPAPSDCLIAVAPPFIYDWETGEELLVGPPNPDLRIYAFNAQMERVHYAEVGRTREDAEQGYTPMALTGGGRGVYWGNGLRRGDDGQGRHQEHDVGYDLDQFGRILRRFDLTDYKLHVYPDTEVAGSGQVVGGSGNIGNRAGFAHETLNFLRQNRYRHRYGFGRYRSGRIQFDDFLDVIVEEGEPFPPLLFFPARGEDGFVVSGFLPALKRTPVRRNPFRLEAERAVQMDAVFEFADDLFDAGVYDALQVIASNQDGEPLGIGAGKDYIYVPCVLDTHEPHFPPYRIGILRGFVDWDQAVFPDRRVLWNGLGLTDIGTTLARTPDMACAGD